jgi:hypothetical protein
MMSFIRIFTETANIVYGELRRQRRNALVPEHDRHIRPALTARSRLRAGRLLVYGLVHGCLGRVEGVRGRDCELPSITRFRALDAETPAPRQRRPGGGIPAGCGTDEDGERGSEGRVILPFTLPTFPRTDWFYDAVQFVVREGLFHRQSATMLFGPDAP